MKIGNVSDGFSMSVLHGFSRMGFCSQVFN